MEQQKYRDLPFHYKLARFSLILRKAYPFLGELCMRIEKHRRDRLGLASTDGLRLYLNVERLNTLPEEALNFVLLHELLHIILRHRYPKGMPFYEKRYWNIGFDLTVNWLLMHMGSELKLRGLGIMPIAETMLTADDLSKDPSHVIAQAFVRQAVGQGVLSQTPPLAVEIEWKSFKATLLNDNLFVFDVLAGSDVRGTPSEGEIRELLANCAKVAGKEGLPRRLWDIWDEIRKGRTLPWRLILKQYLEGMQEGDDYDFCPPDKRLLYSGMILPAETLEEGGELNDALIVLDVSDSVDRQELLAQLRQVSNLLRELAIRGSIISFGSSVYQTMELTNTMSLKQFVDDLEVGGGTNWSDVVRYVKEKKRRVKTIIVFTDGYFFSFEEGLSNVVFITQGDYPHTLRKLGKVIQITNNQ